VLFEAADEAALRGDYSVLVISGLLGKSFSIRGSHKADFGSTASVWEVTAG
jgi:hypothetical protein